MDILESIHQLVVLFESFNGFQSCLEQEPAEYKNAYCQSDFPGSCRLRAPPYQRQCQGAHAANGKDNKGCAEIPLKSFSRHGWPDGRIQEFTAVLTLYRFVLNLFGTEWTLLHCLSLLAERGAEPPRSGRFRAPGSPGAERREGAPAQPRVLPELRSGRTSYYLNGSITLNVWSIKLRLVFTCIS